MTVAQCILQSILYADIFEHPMTEREIWRWIPTRVRISKKAFHTELMKLVNKQQVIAFSPFVLLPQHKKYIGIHARRLMISQKKWKRAYKTGKMLRLIPTVLFVGVTGSLAVNNTEENDDIDFCIIASKGTVWITRLLTTLMVELFSRRRHPGSKNIKDTICLNMFLSEDSLLMDKDRQDVYIAHELLQMVPLWERKGIMKKWLLKNTWVKSKYLHAYEEKMKTVVYRVKQNKRAERIYRLFEQPLRWLQLQYMKKRRTIEEIGEDQIRFHPTDVRERVIATYQLACKSYKIPLDNTVN